jgi:hypothetical protein
MASTRHPSPKEKGRGVFRDALKNNGVLNFGFHLFLRNQ